jgi:hypothetical protein
MKKMTYTLVLIIGLMACNEGPVADVMIPKNVVTVGEQIEIRNTSLNHDISMVVLGGEGLFNNAIRVGEDFEVTDQLFVFAYERPGTYTIKVIAELSKFGSSTKFSTVERTITVLPKEDLSLK